MKIMGRIFVKALQLKQPEFWLRVWLDFMILLAFIGAIEYMLWNDEFPGIGNAYLAHGIFTFFLNITVIVCCIGIRYWKKWAVYGFFVIHFADAIESPFFFLSFKTAPIRDMLMMSGRSIGVIFATLLITWLLLRPVWGRFSKEENKNPDISRDVNNPGRAAGI